MTVIRTWLEKDPVCGVPRETFRELFPVPGRTDNDGYFRGGVDLLYDNLTPDQRFELYSTGSLTIKAGVRRNSTYRISTDGRVYYKIDNVRNAWGASVGQWCTFCIRPRNTITLADTILAHKLMLETDLRAWRQHANPA